MWPGYNLSGREAAEYVPVIMGNGSFIGMETGNGDNNRSERS